MMNSESGSLAAMLVRLAEELDVPDSKYQQATSHYVAVADWLRAEGSPLARYGVTVYPQGSFALGTAIKPPEDGDYDVDAVCLVGDAPNWTQAQLKDAVGDRLKTHGVYRSMLSPAEGGRRCWTLKYADGSQFHLDVLPAVPDDFVWLLQAGVPLSIAETAIRITSRDCYGDLDWPKSNPKGYLSWFVGRMRLRFAEARAKLAAQHGGRVEDVPEYAARTPLQRVVQILKRQRDVMFGGDRDRPISIIITTLAAQAYSNEADLEAAYRNVVRGMRSKLRQSENGDWIVLNPVNPRENFADQWEQFPARKENFFAWLEAVESTERELDHGGTFEKRAEVLVESFGAPGAAAAREASGVSAPMAKLAVLGEGGQSFSGLSRLLSVSHRRNPTWPIEERYDASVTASASRQGFRTSRFSDKSPSSPLVKGTDIRFALTTSAPPPFEIRWQVVNTGQEALLDNDLRGDFIRDGVVHTETTKYSGRHFVQAFVLKDGVCVARSRPVYVIVR